MAAEKLSLSKDKIRILLLEGVHRNAVASFKAAGYRNVELLPGALDAGQLKRRIADAHMIGIRSRTRLTKEVLEAAEKLFCIGCFCIGTNQVALDVAKKRGIPVFNAPYSNTRSVAELVIGEIIMLFRRIPERSTAAHAGLWQKTAAGAHEIRGKILGIVGYGHIGSQLSVLAEAVGMQVRYYDIEDKLPLGNARPCANLKELLAASDVVSLHVPATPQTKNMIGAKEIALMRKGGFLINASRGNVVVIEPLARALAEGHLAGAAIDVFPTEPATNEDEFVSPLRGLPNVILTPHIGGSTHEAQANIGTEVADKLVKYSDNGSTLGAVNFVEVSLPVQAGVTRFLHIHRNVPGVLAHINEVFSSRDLNIAGQYLRTDGEIGYVVVDVQGRLKAGMGLRRDLAAIDGTIRVRFLY
jgi:D-3-phosphoglycerate dehydrogenase